VIIGASMHDLWYFAQYGEPTRLAWVTGEVRNVWNVVYRRHFTIRLLGGQSGLIVLINFHHRL
jgi:hypothetical protein